MATANDLITRAMRALGCLGRTEVPSASEASDALTAFNAMLDSWSNEALASYVLGQISFPLVIGQQSYTIGPALANITADRPLSIQDAFIRDSSNLDYPMRIIPRDIWNDIGAKNISSQIPDTIFYDTTYPLGTIYVFPIPLIGYSCYIYSSTNQVTFAGLTTVLAMPVGYERAYVLNLAVELMSAGFPVLLNDIGRQALIKNASDSKANIKSTNISDVIASYDGAIVSRSYASYNIYNDGRTQ